MVVPLIAAGTRVVGAKLVRGQTSKAASKKGVKNSAAVTQKAANNNSHPKPYLAVDNTRGATVSEGFAKKYEGNSVSESRGIRAAKAAKDFGNDSEIENYQENVAKNNPPQPKELRQKLSGLTAKIKTTSKIARVLSIISAVAFPLWLVIQIPFTAIGLMGLGVEAGISAGLSWVPIVGDASAWAAEWVIPGYELFGASWALNTTIGLLTLLSSIAALVVFRVPWRDGRWSEIALLGAIIGYCSPVLQMFPWVYLFLFMVWVSRVRD